MTHALVFVALGVVLVTSVQLTSAERRSSEEDESESKTPNVVAPSVLRRPLTSVSKDEDASGEEFFEPLPVEERTDKRRHSEEGNAARYSERPSRRRSSREKGIACNVTTKTGPKRENRRKPPTDSDDDDDESRQRERQRRRGSSQKSRNRNKQSNSEDYGTEAQRNSTRIPHSQGKPRGRSSPIGSGDRFTSSTQITRGPPPGEEDELEERPSRSKENK